MREMSIKDIQSVSLGILKDVHLFCIEHSIKYTLFGGTMIGAIRHRGFIPWDDDIDLAMPRYDYEYFIRNYYSKKGYELKCYERQRCQLAFARVCEMKDTLVRQSLPWCNDKTGVYIDVFPLDGVPDNRREAEFFINRLHFSWTCLKLSRVSQRKLRDQKTLENKLNILIRKLLFRNPITKRINWTKRHIKKCKTIPFGETQHFANVSFMEYKMKEYQLLEDFQHTILQPFEGEMFCVCNGYDRLMRTKYGDYMQLPPEHQRKQKHGGSKFYWKDK